MIVSANGIVFNEYSDVLLIQRDDTRTLAPPGGACEIDELPALAAVREVREETGLIVHPVRLVGLYFLPTRPNAYLFLCFRCMERGGELATSKETPKAGFFATNPFAGPMLTAHKEQVQRAFHHHGGPPYWGEHQISTRLRAGGIVLNRLIYPWFKLRRKLSGQPEYIAPPQWQVRAVIVISNDRGEVLCLRNGPDETWRLPSSTASGSEAPWYLARQVVQEILSENAVLSDLSGIYLKQGQPEMIFVFKAETTGTMVTSGTFLAPNKAEKRLTGANQTIIKDAIEAGESLTYKVLT